MSARRAIAWRRGYHAAVATRLLPWAHGTVVRTDDVPSYHEYNLARVEGPDPGLDAEALVAAAEPALADLGHRRIEAEDTGAGARLAPGFAGLGWVVERLAFLHRELPAAAPEPVRSHAEPAIEGFEATRELRGAWQGESTWGEGEGFALIEADDTAGRQAPLPAARLPHRVGAARVHSRALGTRRGARWAAARGGRGA